MRNLEKTMRTALRQARMHHQSTLEGFGLPRKEGGLGIVDISELCVAKVQQLRE